ncbi:MAG: Methyltransferase type 11 [Microbacteriaceae bacterium]|nr:Methyltransferase type 11 [Microbacteriaceae bacterium]
MRVLSGLVGKALTPREYALGMTFEVPADDYDSFMGRFSGPLAVAFAARFETEPGARALDVGCGTGALTARLVERLGAENVAAVDPSESFVDRARERFPGADVRRANAEQLPFADRAFDLALAQLVVPFMDDAVAGIAEMARVTREGGTVAASVWDHGTGRSPLAPFWRAVEALDPAARDESHYAGVREGDLAVLFADAGLRGIVWDSITVTVPFESADAWWQPFTLGVSPAGAYVASLTVPERERLRERCLAELSTGAFELDATAWVAAGRP